MAERNQHRTVGSSKGKCLAKSVPTPAAPPKMKRQLVSSDEDDDDEPLVSKRYSVHPHDQSLEGWLHALLLLLNQLNAGILLLEVDMKLNLSGSDDDD